MSRARDICLAALVGAGFAAMALRGTVRHADDAARAIVPAARAFAAEVRADPELPRRELTTGRRLQESEEEPHGTE